MLARKSGVLEYSIQPVSAQCMHGNYLEIIYNCVRLINKEIFRGQSLRTKIPEIWSRDLWIQNRLLCHWAIIPQLYRAIPFLFRFYVFFGLSTTFLSCLIFLFNFRVSVYLGLSYPLLWLPPTRSKKVIVFCSRPLNFTWVYQTEFICHERKKKKNRRGTNVDVKRLIWLRPPSLKFCLPAFEYNLTS